jgi:lysozyme family protein
MFQDAFNRVVLIEGGYSDDPNDPGGATSYGITEAVARANGYTGDMRALPRETAELIYRRQYWDTLRLDGVNALSPDIAEEMFEEAVNMGVGTAGKFLQRALTALNRNGVDYPDLTVDGVIGPMTIAALKAYLTKRGMDGAAVMLHALNAQQACRYIEIVESRPASENFLYGWISKRVT